MVKYDLNGREVCLSLRKWEKVTVKGKVVKRTLDFSFCYGTFLSRLVLGEIVSNSDFNVPALVSCGFCNKFADLKTAEMYSLPTLEAGSLESVSLVNSRWTPSGGSQEAPVFTSGMWQHHPIFALVITLLSSSVSNILLFLSEICDCN